MEYQLRTKTSEAIDFNPGETLLALFEGRISPKHHQFELVELTSGTFSNIHEHCSLSVPRASGNVGNACNPSVMQIFEPESIESSVRSKEKGGDHA